MVIIADRKGHDKISTGHKQGHVMGYWWHVYGCMYIRTTVNVLFLFLPRFFKMTLIDIQQYNGIWLFIMRFN